MTYQKNKPETIRSMFNSIASKYDRTNAVLSLSLHKYWNRRLVNLVTKGSSELLVDLCAGTGDISIAFLKSRGSPSKSILVDFCPQMLACANDKCRSLIHKGHIVQFIEADVQSVPLDSDFASFATMAYGIRNVKNPEIAIREAYRILKPGGRFGILELTEPKAPLLKMGHRLYLKTVLPLLGKWLTSNQAAYEYLRNSIHTFISPETIQQMFISQGFVETSVHSLAGGIATIIIGQKK